MTDYFLLTASFLVAFHFRNTIYRHIWIVLAAEFLIMTGYQEIVLDKDTGIIFETYRQMAPFYMFQMAIQSGFTMAYIYLRGFALAILSVVIMINLAISMVLSLYDIEATYFSGIMLILAILQLTIGFVGSVDAYRNYFNSMWSHYFIARHKGA